MTDHKTPLTCECGNFKHSNADYCHDCWEVHSRTGLTPATIAALREEIARLKEAQKPVSVSEAEIERLREIESLVRDWILNPDDLTPQQILTIVNVLETLLDNTPPADTEQR